MDEFGVLTERFGLKPQGKSAPMAASKRPTSDMGLNPQMPPYSSRSPPANSNSDYASFLDGLHSSSTDKTHMFGGLDGYDDIFGGPVKPAAKLSEGSSFNFDSILSGSNAKRSSLNSYSDDYDVFGGMPGLKSSGSAKSNVNDDDIFGSFASVSKQSAPVDDLLGDLSGARQKLQTLNGNNDKIVNRSAKVGKNGGDFDDLLPGFRGSTPSNNGSHTEKNRDQQSTIHSTKSNFRSSLEEDPFVVLESVSTSTSIPAYNSSDIFSELEQISKFNNSGGAKLGVSSNSSTKLKSPPESAQVSKGDKERSSGVSSIDELEEFSRGTVRNNSTGHTNVRSHEERVDTSATRRGRSSEDDLMGFRSNSVPRSRTTTLDPVFDARANNKGGPSPQTKSGTSTSMKKSSSATRIFDDLFSMDGGSPGFVEFEEVEGESEERRRARLGRHQRAKERALQAVADMNQRDRQTQQEQEERRRIALTLDSKIKSWSYGKEGNMRALLSSLQCVLWPESGWESVSLTDLITSASVKKVYRKATLCIHPDKVQQKGASLEQKYTAEKVFDILKEAWNKFNKEELS